MSRKNDLFAAVTSHGIIGVVREDSVDDALSIARTIAANGIEIVEVTLTTPDAFSIISTLAAEFAGTDIVIAAGTVRGHNDAASAARAGAQILVSPHTDSRVMEYAVEHDLLCVAGCATATEIIRAWEAGADFVKIYPAQFLGGPDYIRTIRGPIRDVPMIAGGPVPLEMIELYFGAGVSAVNLGPSLAVPDLVRRKDWDAIGKRAASAVSTVRGLKSNSGVSVMVH